jgi:carbamoyltransferase
MRHNNVVGTGPLALGIHWAHDAAVAICSPQGILCAIQEERINRIKHYYGFPCNAIELAMRYCGITASDIDFVAFSTNSVMFPEHNKTFLVETDGTVRPKKHLSEMLNILFDRRAKQQEKVRLGWGEQFADRHYSMKLDYLRDLGFMNERIAHYYISHHRAHAASAFRFSGFPEACIITMDGKGDGLSATIYKGNTDGTLELLRSSKASDSLGAFYQAITEALGFIPVDGEYKTMGLAALGDANGESNPFNPISVKNGILKSNIEWTYRDFNAHNPGKEVPNPLNSVAETEKYKKHLQNMSKENIAYFAQQHCEESMLKYVQNAMKITNCSNIAAAGGVMLNVKANSRIRDELNTSGFFLFPDASDSGLAAGAAIETLYQAGYLRNTIQFSNPYMGHSFGDNEIYNELVQFMNEYGLSVLDATPELIANNLATGKVIGTFQGRMEMGPRALGNRSVLADPRSEAVKDRINILLKGREWFVPFAPIVMREDANKFWDGIYDYYYMTFAVNANEYAKKTVPGVVHVDGTMRPQVVTYSSNPIIYNLLKEFKKKTGIGLLINTSFNRHGLPIVGNPKDALNHLINRWVDGLYIGKWYVEMGK